MTAKTIGSWLRRVLSIQALVAFSLGLVIGLVILGWNVWPVTWIDADPSDLRASQQDAYLQLVAESYALTGNASFARERLLALKKPVQTDADLSTMIEAAAQVRNQAGKAEDAIRLQRLVTALSLPPAGAVTQPAAQPTPQPTPQPASPPTSSGKTVLRVLGTALFLILLAAGAMFLFTQLQKREPRRRRFTPASVSSAIEVEEKEAKQAPVETTSAADASVMQFIAEYNADDEAYDVSFSIEPTEGNFLGECGISALEHTTGEPGRFGAFEIWLFDKLEANTETRLLLSQGAANDPVLRARLPNRGEPVQADLGRVITLETENLRLIATVTNLEYEDASKMVLTRLVTKLEVLPKTHTI